MLKTHLNVCFLPVFCAIIYFLKDNIFSLGSIEHTTHACFTHVSVELAGHLLA